MAQTKTYTFTEFEQYIEAYPNQLFELIEGEIVPVPTAGGIHGLIVVAITTWFFNCLVTRPFGFIYGDANGYRLSDDTYVIPDASYISRERRPDIWAILATAPELAIKVVSPSNTPREMLDKVELYLHYGSLIVWLVYPEKRVVDVYTRNVDGSLRIQKHTNEDTLRLPDLLPDFELPVATIFAPLD